eukprot:353437-Chlamydomonas_euryale.AAC.2
MKRLSACTGCFPSALQGAASRCALAHGFAAVSSAEPTRVCVVHMLQSPTCSAACFSQDHALDAQDGTLAMIHPATTPHISFRTCAPPVSTSYAIACPHLDHLGAGPALPPAPVLRLEDVVAEVLRTDADVLLAPEDRRRGGGPGSAGGAGAAGSAKAAATGSPAATPTSFETFKEYTEAFKWVLWVPSAAS